MGGAMGKLNDLRNRRSGATVHPDSELEQPLLATSAAAAADGLAPDRGNQAVEDAVAPSLAVPKPRRQPAEQHELPLHLSAVVRALAAAWQCLLGLLRRLLPFGRGGTCIAPVQLSPLEQDRLQHLRQRAAVQYDAEDAEHKAALQELWSAAFPGSPFPPGIKHPQWKEMGWQGEDPGTDFRGAGFISLEALLWMAQQRRDTFLALMNKQAGVRSEWEYPFAAGAVNLAYMLTEVLELRPKGPSAMAARRSGSSTGGSRFTAAAGVEPVAALPPPATPAACGFLPLLAQSGTAFEELFVLSYRLLDVLWLERGASYMEFPLVMCDLRIRVEACLASQRPKSLAQLEQLLLPPAAAL